MTLGIWTRPSMAIFPPAGGVKFARWVSMRPEVQVPELSRRAVIFRLPEPSKAMLRVSVV
ncbi:hypothetical protein LZG04_28685 [Saccharothrix sp. S26]|uniref:hypothetical protein n=1 Tax=Saccharothrix sp. S26 TaxID=2907215 RepID=UPI001F3D901D|nr:hypothetical protein [Saccharothrix sp. S26]MCE6998743.1 hypothetical protein [Saccharothrix sp. S26]